MAVVKSFPDKLKQGQELETLLIPQLELLFEGYEFTDQRHQQRDEDNLQVPDFFGYNYTLKQQIFVDAKCRNEYTNNETGIDGYYGIDEWIWKDYNLYSYKHECPVLIVFWNKVIDNGHVYILNVDEKPCWTKFYKNSHTRFQNTREMVYRWHKDKLVKRKLNR